MNNELRDFVLTYKDVNLRYLEHEDIEKFIKWHVEDMEWQRWDAPWEKIEHDENSLRERLERILSRPRQKLQGRLQICHFDGNYIGWVSFYRLSSEENDIAIGIDIPEQSYWGKGLGEQAFKLWISYIFNVKEIDYIYCETWSGNTRMIKLAQKCGFEIVDIDRGYRQVEGKPVDGLKFKLDKEKFYQNNKEIMDEVQETITILDRAGYWNS